jgi:hypothetical protein
MHPIDEVGRVAQRALVGGRDHEPRVWPDAVRTGPDVHQLVVTRDPPFE